MSIEDEQIEEMWYIYTNEYNSAFKKNEIMPFAAMWMHPETVIPSKSDRREIQYHIPYMWNLTVNDTNELTKQKDSQTQRMNL